MRSALGNAAAVLRASLGLRGRNPVYDYIWRRSRDRSQVAMLMAATVVSAFVLLWLKAASQSESNLVEWLVLRWSLGEFLWIWMAADHCFTEVGRARSCRILRDLKLTSLRPSDVTEGVTFATWRFLAIAIIVWGIAECFFPFSNLNSPAAGSTPFILTWYLAVPLALTLNHLATALLASAVCVEAAGSPGGSLSRWAITVGSLIMVVVVITLVALPIPLVFHFFIEAALEIKGGNLSFSSHLARNPLLVVIWLIPMVIIPCILKLSEAGKALKSAGEKFGLEGSEESLPADGKKTLGASG